MSWGSQRKIKIIGGFFVLMFSIIGFFVVQTIRAQKPTCFDVKQNGSEQGIDCGGMCEIACRELLQEPNALWQRSYEITKGFYNAAAYIENQNTSVGVKKVSYSFKLFDKDRILIAERGGETYLEPKKGFIVFEQQIPVGEKIPLYTTFEFTSPLVWYKTNPLYSSDLNIETTGMTLDEKDIKPRFTATLNNLSLKRNIEDIDIYVVLYDTSDSVIQVAKTKMTLLPARTQKDIFVVWQKQFTVKPVRYEVITRYNPFTQVYTK